MSVSCWAKLAIGPVTAAVYLMSFLFHEASHLIQPKNLFLQHILQPKSLPEVFP